MVLVTGLCMVDNPEILMDSEELMEEVPMGVIAMRVNQATGPLPLPVIPLFRRRKITLALAVDPCG